LIEAIKDDYSLLLKKMSGAVLFRIERSDWRRNPPENEFELKEFRIVPLIFQRTLLLQNLNPDEIIKLLFMIRTHDKCSAFSHEDYRALWSFLTTDLLMKWITQEKSCTDDYVKAILMHNELLNKFDDTQVVSLAKHLGVDTFEELLNCPVFRARLQKNQNDNPQGSNKLLMILAQDPETHLNIPITENPYTAALLTHDEIIALMMNTKKCTNTTFLVKHDVVLNKLTSAELFGAVEGSLACCEHIANGHLWRLNDPDLVKFIESHLCYLEHEDIEQLNGFLKIFPAELEKRSMTLTSAQWLSLARIYPDLGVMIANDYLNKMVDSDLEQLSQDYRENEIIQERIKSLKDQRIHDARRQQEEAENERRRQNELRAEERRLQLIANLQHAERSANQDANRVDRLSPHVVIQHLAPNIRFSSECRAELAIAPKRNRWQIYLAIVLLALACFIGFGLVSIGLGSIIGIPVALTITATLFPFLSWGSALTISIIGLLTIFTSLLGIALISDSTSTPATTTTLFKKPTGSTTSLLSQMGHRSDTALSNVNDREPTLTTVRCGFTELRPAFVQTTTFAQDEEPITLGLTKTPRYQ
jgi:hypothetical protein